MDKKGDFTFQQIIIFLLVIATLFAVLFFYGGLRDKIMSILGEVF